MKDLILTNIVSETAIYGVLLFILGIACAGCGNPGGRQTRVIDVSQKPVQVSQISINASIKAGEPLVVNQATPYMKVSYLKLRSNSIRTRLLINLQFTSRDVKGAKFDINLKDADGDVLATCKHVEETGPEQVTHQGASLPYVRFWNQTRGVWIDLSKDAERATVISVHVTALH